ncbi:MAG: hypothetical protein ACN6QY_15700 [Pseudomonas sp.]
MAQSLEVGDVVKAKVATGEYATESEVIRDDLGLLVTLRPRLFAD